MKICYSSDPFYFQFLLTTWDSKEISLCYVKHKNVIWIANSFQMLQSICQILVTKYVLVHLKCGLYDDVERYENPNFPGCFESNKCCFNKN